MTCIVKLTNRTIWRWHCN